MNESPQEPAAHVVGPPDGKVIGAVEPDAAARACVALAEAGFDPGTIDVVTAADLAVIGGPFEHTGLRGFLERFLLSFGEEYSALTELRQMAHDGRTLIGVPVTSDDAMHRAARVLRGLGAHEVTHFGRWKVTTL